MARRKVQLASMSGSLGWTGRVSNLKSAKSRVTTPRRRITTRKQTRLSTKNYCEALSRDNQTRYNRLLKGGITVDEESQAFTRPATFRFAGLDLKLSGERENARLGGYRNYDLCRLSLSGGGILLRRQYSFTTLPVGLARFLYDITMQESALRQRFREQKIIDRTPYSYEAARLEREGGGIGCGEMEW